MGQARYLLVYSSRGENSDVASWPGGGRVVPRVRPGGDWYAWRLVGPNQRELGRSASVYESAERVLAAIEALRGSILSGEVEAAGVPLGGRQSWSVRNESGHEIAVASRGFARAIECQHNLRLFLDQAPTAVVDWVLPPQRTDDLRPAGV